MNTIIAENLQLQASKGLSLNQPYSIGYQPKENKDKGAVYYEKNKVYDL